MKLNFFCRFFSLNKRFLLSGLLFMTFLSCFSNNNQKKNSSEYKKDTAEIRILYNEIMEAGFRDSISSVNRISDLFRLSEKWNYSNGKTKAYFAMGRLLYDYDNLEEAISYFKKGIISAILSENTEDKMQCYYWIARCYRRIADYPKYEKYLRLLQTHSIKSRNKQYLSYAYEGFGNLYRYMGEYSRSIDYYMQSIELSKSTGRMDDVSMSLNNMSLVYEYQGKINHALEIQLHNLAILKQLNNKKDMVLCLSNLYNLYKKLGGDQLAKHYLNEAMGIVDELGEENINFKEAASAYSQFAEMQLEKKHFETALEYYNKEFRLLEKHKDVKGTSESYGNIANTYELMGEFAMAEKFYEKKLEITRKIDYTKGQVEAIHSLMNLKVKQNNFKEAFVYSKKHFELYDKLRNKESIKQKAEFETKMSVKEQKQQIDLLLKDNALKSLELEREKYNSSSLTIGIVLLLSIIAIFYWGYKQKLRVNKELSGLVIERTKILNRRNKDLKDFIYRSSHELRSPIVNIKGLLAIIESEKNNTEVVNDCLVKISGVVERQDLMLQNLLRVNGLINNKFEPEHLKIKTMFEDIVENFKYSEFAVGVDTIIQSDDDVELKTDRVMLSSIIENLVINAMKYKRRQKEKSYVKLEAFKDRNGVTIKISDNGIGISEEWKEKVFEIFTRATNGVPGFGLGLYIVRNTVELLGGHITVSSHLRAGSEFTIWLPLKHKIRELA